MSTIFGFQAEYEWISTAAEGAWSDPSNWKDGRVPNGPDTVVLLKFPPRDHGIRLDIDVTVGKLVVASNKQNSFTGTNYTHRLLGSANSLANANIASTTTLTFENSSDRAELYVLGDGAAVSVDGNMRLNSDLNAIVVFANAFLALKAKINLNGNKIFRSGRGGVFIEALPNVNATGHLESPGEIHLVDNALLLRHQGWAIGNSKIVYYTGSSANRAAGAFGFNNYSYESNRNERTLVDPTVVNDFQFIKELLPDYASTVTRGGLIHGPQTNAKAVFTGSWSGDLWPSDHSVAPNNGRSPIFFSAPIDHHCSLWRFGIWLDGNHSGLISTRDNIVYYIARYGAIKIGPNWTPPGISYRLRFGGRANSDYDKIGDAGFLLDSTRTSFAPAQNEVDCWTNFTTQASASFTQGSTTITFPTSGQGRPFFVGQSVTATALPAGTTITAIPNQDTIVVSSPATQTTTATLTIPAYPRAGAYNVIGVSHTSGSSTWGGAVQLNYGNVTGNNAASASTVLLARGSSTVTFSGNFTGSNARFTPIYKMGTGEAILSGTGSSATQGQFIVREGALTINGAFTATGANATTFLVGLKKYALSFNEVIRSGETVQPVVNGTALTTVSYTADASNTLFRGAPQTGGGNLRPFSYLLRLISQHPDTGIIWAEIENADEGVEYFMWTDFEVFPRGHSDLSLAFNLGENSTLTYTYTDLGPAPATLRGTGTIAGSVTVMDHENASIQPGSTASPYGTLTVGSLTAGASSRLRFAASGASISKITVNGNYTAQGTFVITGTLQPGTYDLITCTGTLTAGTTSLDTSGASGFSSAVLNVNVGSKKVQLVVT